MLYISSFALDKFRFFFTFSWGNLFVYGGIFKDLINWYSIELQDNQLACVVGTDKQLKIIFIDIY